MKVKVEFHPSTIADLNQAVAYYEAERPGLGAELREEIYRSIDRIRQSPESFPVVRNELRRCIAHRFPFSILFRLVGEETARVLVIMHHRRKPTFGTRRR